ncbi:hypothetical protein [Nannocystis radixulma]|uniref:Uncharacterized protein n=1 Tax=Nannocystis radixulma TaxID=2995305 RepID=A0ABT5B853_9BACT|nr:hypothetical protein [Nannocystis radixulma]MDC0669201.1 hypothetical protein [Nannocystis radixulma]
MHAAFIATALALATPVVPVVPPDLPATVDDETRRLFEQPLTSFEDACEAQGDSRVRRVRFATLSPAGLTEDRLELRTTTWPTSQEHILEYLVNDVVMFTQVSDVDVRPTPAGARFLHDRSAGARREKVLAAFAAAHPRIFAADVQAPQQSCGTLRGKHEEKGKCAAIAALGCVPKIVAICLASLGAGYLCNYLVDRTCDENPDSCEPGWTTGE